MEPIGDALEHFVPLSCVKLQRLGSLCDGIVNQHPDMLQLGHGEILAGILGQCVEVRSEGGRKTALIARGGILKDMSSVNLDLCVNVKDSSLT